MVLQSTVTPKHVIATGMATCCTTSQLTSLSTTIVMIAEETWYDRMQLWRVKGRHGLEGSTSQFVRLEKFSLNFSSLAFVIRDNLLHLVYLEGHSQLAHMRTGYHSIANLHIKETR